MKYKAILFDLDGTLIYTAPQCRYLLVGKVLRDLNVEVSNHYIDRFWFESRREEIIKNFFKVDSKLFWEKYRNYDSIDLRKQFMKLYDDVNFIKELRSKGYKIGIVTGAPTHIAAIEIEMLGKENFDAIVIAHTLNEIKPKPHPQGIKECLNMLGVKNNEVIYVGNSDEDVMAAKNAQVFDVFLSRGEHEFPEINPSLTIKSLYELKELLK